jgi:hypothetical protein
MFSVKNSKECGRNVGLRYFTRICVNKGKENDKITGKIGSLRVAGSVPGNCRIKNGRAKLRLRADYFTVLTIDQQGG